MGHCQGQHEFLLDGQFLFIGIFIPINENRYFLLYILVAEVEAFSKHNKDKKHEKIFLLSTFQIIKLDSYWPTEISLHIQEERFGTQSERIHLEYVKTFLLVSVLLTLALSKMYVEVTYKSDLICCVCVCAYVHVQGRRREVKD